MRIIVSNPSKQYTPQTVKALMPLGKVTYFTCFWYKKKNPLLNLIAAISPKHNREFKKKTDNSLPNEIIETNIPGSLYKFFGRFIYRDVEQWSYNEDRIHDAQAKKRLSTWKPDVIIGYEKSCIDTFTAAKRKNIMTVLDLSQVHADFIKQLRNDHPFFSDVTGSLELFDKINQQKKAEYALADHIIALSEFAKHTLLQYGIAPHKVSVANLGFNPQQFTIKEYKPAQQLRLVYVGIVTLRKGIQLLIDLMQQCQHMDITLTVIGPRGDASHLLNNNSNYPNIRYIEYLHHDELVKELQQSDVFVLPSFLDSWAAVAIEAMACGLPAILSDQTGAMDAIDDSCGIVVKTGDEQALKDAIMHFYNNRQLLESMGRNAHAKAQQYTWKHYHQRIQTIIANITKDQSVHA